MYARSNAPPPLSTLAQQGAVILAFTPRVRDEDDILFTMQDRIDLMLWSNRSRVARLEVEPGMRGAGPDRASFALIYVGSDPWSRWGVTRSGQGVVTWCCRTGQDLTVTRTVSQALAALPV